MKRLFGILIGILLAQSCTQQNSKIDSDAYDVIALMAETYRGLKSYRFEGTIQTRVIDQETPDDHDLPFTVAGVTPGKLYVKFRNPYTTQVTITIRDTTTVYVGDGNRFTKQVVAPVGSVADSVIRTNALASGGIDILGDYLTILSKLRSLRFVKEESFAWGGSDVRCDVVEIELAPTPPRHGEELKTKHRILWIDQRRHIVLIDSMSYTAKIPRWPRPKEMTMVRRFTSAQLNVPPPDSLFTFTPPGFTKLVDGTAAEQFTLHDLQGNVVSLKSFQGKVVLLDFWATWCGPCREELPTIEKLHVELRPMGLVVLGVNDESADVASKFMKEQQYTFPTLVDEKREVSGAYDVNMIPTVVIIDREGKIASHFVGARSEEELRGALEKVGIR